MRKTLIFTIATFTAIGATAAYADKGLKSADTSGDGFISLEEMQSAHSARVEERFARMDTDADGLLSESEIAAAREARRGERGERRGERRRKMNPERIVERLDTDGSGSVSLAELEAKRDNPDAAAFQTADVDGSGELDASEIKQMIKTRRDARRAEREAQK